MSRKLVAEFKDEKIQRGNFKILKKAQSSEQQDQQILNENQNKNSNELSSAFLKNSKRNLKQKSIDKDIKVQDSKVRAEENYQKDFRLDFYTLKGLKRNHNINYKQVVSQNTKTNSKYSNYMKQAEANQRFFYTSQDVPINLAQSRTIEGQEQNRQFVLNETNGLQLKTHSINSIQNQVGSNHISNFNTLNQFQQIDNNNHNTEPTLIQSNCNKRYQTAQKTFASSYQRSNELQQVFSPLTTFESQSDRQKINQGIFLDRTPKRSNFNTKLPKISFIKTERKIEEQFYHQKSKDELQDISEQKSPLTVKTSKEFNELQFVSLQGSNPTRNSLNQMDFQNLNFAE